MRINSRQRPNPESIEDHTNFQVTNVRTTMGILFADGCICIAGTGGTRRDGVIIAFGAEVDFGHYHLFASGLFLRPYVSEPPRPRAW